ncbi:MAG: transposase [Proteobacteria bacterium]|nr:transposase [Pseudomonadota bacterium]
MEDDNRQYMNIMREWCERQGVEIWACCLMPSHVHLIAVSVCGQKDLLENNRHSVRDIVALKPRAAHRAKALFEVRGPPAPGVVVRHPAQDGKSLTAGIEAWDALGRIELPGHGPIVFQPELIRVRINRHQHHGQGFSQTG